MTTNPRRRDFTGAVFTAVLILAPLLVLARAEYGLIVPFWLIPAAFHFYRRERGDAPPFSFRVAGEMTALMLVLTLGSFLSIWYAVSQGGIRTATLLSGARAIDVLVTAAVFVAGALTLVFLRGARRSSASRETAPAAAHARGERSLPAPGRRAGWLRDFDRALAIAIVALAAPLVLLMRDAAAVAPFFVAPALFRLYFRSRHRSPPLTVAVYVVSVGLAFAGISWAGSSGGLDLGPGLFGVVAAIFLAGGLVVFASRKALVARS